MTMIKRVLLLLFVLLVVSLAYLAIKPAPIDPVAWDPPAPAAMVGPLAPNARLSTVGADRPGPARRPRGRRDRRGGPPLRRHQRRHDRARDRHEDRGPSPRPGGRPLGLDFAPDGALIVADAKKGLLSVAPDGAVTLLTDSADGLRFGFTDDVVVASDGVIYFTDASDKFGFGDHMLDLLEGRGHGRLLRYDPVSKATKVLAQGLYFANGVALAKDESFVVINETYRFRLARHWLRGPKAGTTEPFGTELPGFPDGVSQSGRGTFWVAMFTVRNPAGDFLAPRPFLKKMVANLPRFLWPKPEPYGLVIELDETGAPIRSLHDVSGAYVEQVTSVHERGDRLYLGHLHRDRITRVPL
jgi:sugar lactone lactonase YvrE